MGSNGNHTGKLLVGIGKITKYLDIGKPMFHEFRKSRPPMPVRFLNGRWIAHQDNLDEYFRRITLADSSALDVLDGEE